MRPVLAGDIFALANALLTVPPARRQEICSRIIKEADWADKYRKRFHRLHPAWGNGSLMGRVGMAEGSLRASPVFHTQEFCTCVVIVLQSLQDWRSFKHSRAAWIDVPKRSEKAGIYP